MEGVQPTPLPASTNAAMVKLWCILDTGFEVFGVEVPLTADVDTLKKRIKAENPTDLRDMDARHLRLVKVTNANDGTPVSSNALDGNARRQVADAIHAAVKGGRNVEDGTFKPVENASLKSRVMTPAPTATIAHYRFKPPPPPPAVSPDDMADDDDFVPQQFVHILVVLPEATTATQAGSSNPGLIDAIAHRVVEAINDQERRTVSVAFSQITGALFQTIATSLQLQLVLLPLHVNQPLLWPVSPFQWSDLREDDPDQMDNCRQHCQRIFLPRGSAALTVRNLTNNRHFLDRTIGNVTFRGTTDLAVTVKGLLDILLLVELKRPGLLREGLMKFQRQTVCELLAADLTANQPVIAVLTDLQDYWEIFWIVDPNEPSVREELRKAMIFGVAPLVVAHDVLSRDKALSIVQRRMNYFCRLYDGNSSSQNLTSMNDDDDSGDGSRYGEMLKQATQARCVAREQASAGSGGGDGGGGGGVGGAESRMEEVFDVMTAGEVFEYQQRRIMEMVRDMAGGLDIPLKKPFSVVASQ